MCQTPFGITANCTWHSSHLRGLIHLSAKRLSASLLIALGMAPTLNLSPCSAKRLSASLLIAQIQNTLVHLLRLRAKRLSASLLIAPGGGSPNRRGGSSVLNAFRHHCLLHNSIDFVDGFALVVLNAFRHHCVLHHIGIIQEDNCQQC